MGAKPDRILKLLADTYDQYEAKNWKPTDGGMGGMLIEQLLKDSKRFHIVCALIGQGLDTNIPSAIKACQLFEKLYKEGFQGGLYQKEVRANFATILPSASIQRLDEGESFQSCMQALYTRTELDTESRAQSTIPGPRR